MVGVVTMMSSFALHSCMSSVRCGILRRDKTYHLSLD